jgi:ATP-binding cassette subfamily B protein
MSTRRYTDRALYRRLLRQSLQLWPVMAAIFLLSLASGPIALLLPLPIKIAVDHVIGHAPLPGWLSAFLPSDGTGTVLMAAAVLVVVIALLQQGEACLSWLLQRYAGERLTLDFRAKLFHHAQRLSLLYHDATGSTDTLYRIQYDAPAVQYVMLTVVPVVTSVFTLLCMVVVTARLDLQLAAIGLTVVPVLAVLTEFHRRRVRSGWSAVKEYDAAAMGVVQEVLSSLRVVKAFGQEHRERERFAIAATRGMRAQIGMMLRESVFTVLIATTLAVGTAVALWVGAGHVQAGRLTLGELLLVMAYLAQLYKPLETISRQISGLQGSLASAERTFELLDRDPDVPDRPDARPISRARGEVEFRNVSVAYRADRTILRDVSFTIRPGDAVGIAGQTGAGKSSLVHLLLRLHDPSDGEVLLDGQPLSAYRLADLRNQFAIVLQEPVLFSTTIAENIAYGRPDASEAEIIDAARAANAHDFIMRLPQRYQTQVGERGMSLSGGERQRVAIARAFLKDAPLLILDEPTSSVDTVSEAAIVEAVQRLAAGRTTFIIAHRLSTLEMCNRRIQVADGSATVTRMDSVFRESGTALAASG